jgi:CPA2 family monovalent cation:H+ antiporter-2
MLAETEYSKAVETTVEPFKGLLLGIFFFTVGMNIDFRELLREPWLLAGVVFGLLLVKSILLLGLTKLFRFSWPAAIETSVLLGPGGEFAFVAIGMAAASGFVSHHLSSFVIAVTTISMLLTPALATAARRGRHLLAKTKTLPNPELAAVPQARAGHAIVVGYGRVGKVVCSLLKEHKLPYIAADHDPASVTKDREEGHEFYYGEATDPGFLETCGLMQASGIIVTTHDQRAIDHIVEHVRTRRSDILIVSRAWDANHARHLYKVGVTDVVPETIEASLQLSQSVLVRLGVQPEEAMLSIHEKRNEFRRDLLSSTGQ